MTELGQMLREDGIKEGMEKVAFKMSQEHLPVELIQKVTGLSVEEIENITKNLKN